MMKKIVIAGSVSLQQAVIRWKSYWEQEGYRVLDYPQAIARDLFLKDYPSVFLSFFNRLSETDLVFIMNEDKNSVVGYIGSETFAELAYSVYLRMKSSNRPKIILLKEPSAQVRGVEEVELWHQLGLIEYLGPQTTDKP